MPWLWPEAAFDEPARMPLAAARAEADVLARGEYLARIGDCKACHTRRGGEPYSGGRAIPTPFGTFYSPNITPDAANGIGGWSADDFWSALHDGKARDGKLLYPAFPYTNYTRVTRADADALYAYLRTVAASPEPRREHNLRFPYRHRALLAGWRLLFFKPGEFEPDTSKSPSWNRGAYLVQGLGHCSACHEARNRLGAIRSTDNPAGGLVLSWYAPSLHASAEAGLQGMTQEEGVRLLTSGKTEGASTMGPMAEVVYESLQHLTAADADAMVEYLRSLPDAPAPHVERLAAPGARRAPQLRERGKGLYAEHCASCHGRDGEGEPDKGPALAGNRAVRMGSVVNLARIIRFGGYPPGTAGNPRPSGMPPFAETLDDEDIAALLTFLRDGEGAVSAAEVRRYRAGPNW